MREGFFGWWLNILLMLMGQETYMYNINNQNNNKNLYCFWIKKYINNQNNTNAFDTRCTTHSGGSGGGRWGGGERSPITTQSLMTMGFSSQGCLRNIHLPNTYVGVLQKTP